MAERTQVIACTCEHKDQDAMYGKGNRLHNVNTKGDAFCTVCSPNYRRDKNANNAPASPVFGHGTITARRPRNPKKVEV